jgi:WNK lysine deficient protein kinase
MNGFSELQQEQFEYVELDPTGRYGRYNEVLGKGASKTVYRAFDEYEGIEVAWNQVKLYDFLQSPEDLERLYCEIHLLKTLKHINIMKFYTSWVDTVNRNINFVTEMFTSGTLRQYRQRHKRVNIRAVKHWCRQILKGLLYLHSLEPPVIHRDLKCDNIFVNGNQGEVKIGDLGLAAILRKSHAERCVGTPEFMAPEVYAEEYNELVDIYAFGMCILEMVTFEYPYSECTSSAQIYKKVTSGIKPDALYKVTDPEVRRFVEKCLATVSCRLTARELLDDPFLQIDDPRFDSSRLNYFDEVASMYRQPLFEAYQTDQTHALNDYANNYLGYEPEYHSGHDHYEHQEDDQRVENVGITIKGKRKEDDGIFLRLRMADKEGRVRNIYFPFDMETDTAMDVATEMLAELDITEQDVTKIADMIDGEIMSLVPEWKAGLNPLEGDDNENYCEHCASNLQVLQCTKTGCTSVHGRFEEITYQFGGSSEPPVGSSQSDGIQYSDIWTRQNEAETITKSPENETPSAERQNLAEDYEKEIRQEMRWLKAKYQMQLRELKDQQLGVLPKDFNSNAFWDRKGPKRDLVEMRESKEDELMKAFAMGKHFGSFSHEGEDENEYFNPVNANMVTAKTYFSAALLPQSLHRATSLPVDAVDC